MYDTFSTKHFQPPPLVAINCLKNCVLGFCKFTLFNTINTIERSAQQWDLVLFLVFVTLWVVLRLHRVSDPNGQTLVGGDEWYLHLEVCVTDEQMGLVASPICKQVVLGGALRPPGMRRQRGRWASLPLSSKDPVKYKIQITNYTNTKSEAHIKWTQNMIQIQAGVWLERWSSEKRHTFFHLLASFQ